MSHRIPAILSVVLLVAAGGRAAAGERNLTLWYNRPATKWFEALPVGNGRLGAMVFGGVDHEHVQLNEETIWAGPPVPEPHAGIRGAMTEARRAWFADDYAKAHEVLGAALPPRITPCTVRYGGQFVKLPTRAGQVTRLNAQLQVAH